MLDLPSRIFSPLAEQLRWDSLRMGDINLKEWPKVKAYAMAPQPTDKTESTQVVINLFSECGNRINKRYDISTWQGLALYIKSTLFAGEWTQYPEKIELRWIGGQNEVGVPIPLSPLQLPVGNLATSAKSSSRLGPLNLIVSEEAISGFAELSRESLRLGVELGGCLIGRIPNLETIEITEVALASGSLASAAQFSFDPRFWLNTNSRLAGTGLRMLGWYHSHLCDEGFPATLSNRDLWIFYRHFVAPWSVAVLVCVSREQQEVKWFGWHEGSVGTLKEKARRTSN